MSKKKLMTSHDQRRERDGDREMATPDHARKLTVRPDLWLIRAIGVIVPRRLRADWRQEWEAELRYRELLLADWDKLNWKTKLDLLRRSLGRVRGCAATTTAAMGGRDVSRLALRRTDALQGTQLY